MAYTGVPPSYVKRGMMIQAGQAPMSASPIGITEMPAAANSAPQVSAPSPVPSPATQVPPTGLIGSEQALLGGHNAALNSLNTSTGAAANYLGAASNLSVPVSRLGVVDGFNTPYSQSYNSATFNPNAVNTAITQGITPLTSYAQSGESSAKLQADLSGANGPQAQSAAMESVQGNPYAEQMKQNAERAILQNAAVTGSLGGGNVLDQLYKNSAALFAEDYQNRFNNLGTVSDRGLNAATNIGNLRGQQAGILGNLESGRMSANASLEAKKMDNEASILGQKLGIRGNLVAEQFRADQRRNEINTQIKQDAYNRLAGLSESAGLNIAGLQTGTAQQLSQGRTQAGQAIAQNANQAASSISNMLAQNGIAVSDMMAKDISTVTDMIYQSGMQEKIDSQQLAAILANIAGGQASTVSQGYSNIGSANAAGTLGTASAVQGGIEQLIASGVLGGKK